jgi:hypothetical protein
MSEVITTYKLTDLDEPIPMDRDEFYDEQIEEFKKKGKPSRAVEIIQVLLFSHDKDVILQKRSISKRHNAGLIDKSLGGHVTFGNSPFFTVMVETLQELKVSSIVLPSNEDFTKTYKLLKNHLDHTSIVQYVDSRTSNFKKMFGNEEILIANKYHFYLGVYGGSVRPAEQEASGILFSRFENLQEDIKNHPELFTYDLVFFLDKYEKKIKTFLANFK